MTTIEKTYTVYDWDALPDEGKKKALERYSDINVDYEWWMDADYFRPETMPDCLSITNVSFSGFYHQGQGASIQYTVDDEPALIDWLAGEIGGKNGQRFKKVWQAGGVSVYSSNGKGSHGHYYCQYPPLELEADCYSEHKYTQSLVDIAQDILNDAHIDWEADVFSALREEYDCRTSEEAIVETLKINEYMFTIDGKID